MKQLEKGRWPAINAKAIIASVRRVFEKRSIGYLTKAAYEHITLHMKFIAHHDLRGFMDEYTDLVKFARNLLTGEYSRNMQHNVRDADRYIRDDFFVSAYGQAYCESVVAANQGIVELAKEYLAVLRSERDAKLERDEKAELARLQAKYQI